MSTERESEVQSIKEKGNNCVKEQKYEEAMYHYTVALKIDPENYLLYSNRSLVFLKLQQYHLSMEDALMTIQLKPDWIKGYFRKAEVEFHTFRFSEAIQSYKKALELQPHDLSIIDAINKASMSLIQDERADQQIPWLGAGIGLILGVIIVIADYGLTNKPTLLHPILMVLLTMAVSSIGFLIAKGLRYFVKCQRKSLLEPPIDLFEEGENATKNSGKNSDKDKHPRYNKAQARQRLKKQS